MSQASLGNECLYDSGFVLVCYKKKKFMVLHLIKILIRNPLATVPLGSHKKKRTRVTACVYEA